MQKSMLCQLENCVTWVCVIQIPVQIEAGVALASTVLVVTSVSVQTLTREGIVLMMLMSVL